MKQDSNMQGDKVFAKALRLFFFIFIVIGMVIGGGVFAMYTYQSKDFVTDLLAQEKFGIDLRRTIVESSLNSIAADLEFMASQRSVADYVETGGRSTLATMGDDFLAFVQAKGIYDQARLFDASGMELVRVNFNDGLPDIVPENLLQNKGKRYYFTDTMLLNKGEVFVSPMDLNIEQGKVEVPYKPVIRFGTPLYNNEGKQLGAIILNYRADHLLGLLRKTGKATAGQTMLLNNRGYWLLAPDTDDQWGFMLPDRNDISFAHRYSRQWINVRASESGQIVMGNMIFTFATVYPLHTRFRSSTGSESAFSPSTRSIASDQYFWKLVSFVPDSAQQGYSKMHLVKTFSLGSLLFLITGTGAWFLALAVTRRKLYQSRFVEMAPGNILTGLPNRRLFFDHFEQVFEHAERYKHGLGLLYIDIDDFKSVADSLGLDAGDDLLTQVAERFMACCRRSDTVARLGGDEFVIIIPQIEGRETCAAVANKLMEAMTTPFLLGAESVTLSLSIGVSLYPDDSTDRDELLSMSVKAMHKAKMSGKAQVSYG